MKSKNWKLIIGILFVICHLTFVITDAGAKTATDISVVSVGAKSVAMGRSGVAVADKANNAFVNPAAISSVNNWEFTSMSTQMLGSVDYRYAGAAYKTPKGIIGISYVGATSPAGYYTTDEASATTALASPINYGSSVIALSYGARLGDYVKSKNASLGNLSVGTNLKYFSKGFSGGTSSTASGYGLDLGFIMQPNADLSFGLNFQNLISGKVNWDNNTQEDLAAATKLGVSRKIAGGKVTLNADYFITDLSTLHIGTEFKPVEILSLRAGIDQNMAADTISNNLTAGVGLNLRDFELDLAYRQDATLASNSNFYVSISYSPYTPKQVAEIKDVPKATEGGPAGDYMDTVKTKQPEKLDTTIKEAVTEPHKAKKETSTAAVNEYYQSLGIMQ